MHGGDAGLEIVVVTWQGGGVIPPAIGLSRMLALRGHRVRVVAPSALKERVESAGCEHVAHPVAAEFDPMRGRVFEDQEDYAAELFFGSLLATAVDGELARRPADVVVVDYLLRSAASAVERRGAPIVLLMHMAERHHGFVPSGDGMEDWGWRWQYERLNSYRSEVGLAPFPVGPASLLSTLIDRSARVLVVMPREFDPWPDRPENVVHVGPIFEHEPASLSWDSPWAHSDTRPLIVVSMGTMYMGQEDILGRVMTAIADLDVRALVLTGPELDPDEIDTPAAIAVRRYVPHGAVLQDSSLMVTHGGTGTLMASLCAGVPCLIFPLGRDQHENARRISELRAGRALESDASTSELRDAIGGALTSASLHGGARKMATAIEAYGDGARAVDEVEAVARIRAEA